MMLTTQQLAELLHISPRTIERWRVEGHGPAFVKAGRRVLYKEDTVDAWLSAAARGSTSEVPTIGAGGAS
jgi:excisionase family DNA binding protein